MPFAQRVNLKRTNTLEKAVGNPSGSIPDDLHRMLFIIYTSSSLMTDHGVICSMSRSGNVWDNAAMESFFSSLKTERTASKVYRSRDEAKADVFDYIERFYNRASEHPSVYVVEEKRLC
jgi:Integrase core domain